MTSQKVGLISIYFIHGSRLKFNLYADQFRKRAGNNSRDVIQHESQGNSIATSQNSIFSSNFHHFGVRALIVQPVYPFLNGFTTLYSVFPLIGYLDDTHRWLSSIRNVIALCLSI